MQEALFTMAKLEDFVPADHPLRPIRQLVNTALGKLNDLFNQMYPGTGRASIAPEKLMRALLLQVFYSIRSERQLMEQFRRAAGGGSNDEHGPRQPPQDFGRGQELRHRWICRCLPAR